MQRSGFHDALAARGLTIGAFDTLIEHAPVGVYVAHDTEGCIFANEALLEIFGIPWEEFRQFGWAKSVVGEDRDPLWAAFTDFGKREGSSDIRYRIQTPTGDVRVIHAVLHPVPDADGHRLATLGLLRDATLEAAGQEQAVQHQQTRALGELSTRIAHQVNNCLQGVLSAEIALQEEVLSPEGRGLLTQMREAVEETASLARDLAGLGRPDTECAPLDLVLGRRRRLYQELVGERIVFDLHLQTDGCLVGLTEDEFDQVMMHVLLTARRMVGGSGTISITTSSSAEAASVFIALTRQDGVDPFPLSTRADLLGQESIRALLCRIGGELEVTPERLSLRFPLGADEDPPTAEDSVHILLVDDHFALRQSLAHAIALQGHTVYTASSVMDALEVLTAHAQIDVVVTDLLLLDGDGSEVGEAASHRDPPAQVVYMSGYPREAVQMIHPIDPEALFLQKPFGPGELLRAISVTSRASRDVN